jgi:hypothetical protein
VSLTHALAGLLPAYGRILNLGIPTGLASLHWQAFFVADKGGSGENRTRVSSNLK